MTSATTDNVEYNWKPDQAEFTDLVWTLFPEEIGAAPRCDDTSIPAHLDRFVPVAMDTVLFDKLLCFATATALSIPEVIRRLLESEVTLYGRFEQI